MQSECSTRTTITQRSSSANPLKKREKTNERQHAIDLDSISKFIPLNPLLPDCLPHGDRGDSVGHAPLQRLAGCPIGARQQKNEKIEATWHRGTQHGGKEQCGKAEERSCK